MEFLTFTNVGFAGKEDQIPRWHNAGLWSSCELDANVPVYTLRWRHACEDDDEEEEHFVDLSN